MVRQLFFLLLHQLFWVGSLQTDCICFILLQLFQSFALQKSCFLFIFDFRTQNDVGEGEID